VNAPPLSRRGRRGRLLFVALLALCWLSAGWFPVAAMLRGGRVPNDFTHDYVRADLWVHGGRWGELPAVDIQTGNARAATLGAPSVLPLGSYYVHPPSALVPMLPFTAVSYRVAVAIWQGLTVVLVAVLAWLLAPVAAAAGVGLRPRWLFPIILLWPPVLANLRVGQWSVILAVALAAGHRAWERGNRRGGAAWMGLAAALKVTPLGLLPAVFLRERRAAVWFVGAVALLVAASLPLGGLGGWRAFAAVAWPNAVAYETWIHNTLSVDAVLVRLLGGGEFARPFLAAPILARSLAALVLGALAVVAGLGARRVGSARDRDEEGCVLALWYVLVVVANPLAWSHYAILLLLPAGLTARSAKARGDALASGLCACGLAALSIPDVALDYAALPLPVAPLRSVWLAIPLGGALLIFASAARGVFARRTPPVPASGLG
jgi:Glycosyltransferase family 87